MIKNVITKGQQFFKIHWKKCTFALSVIALLTFLFWYGGDGKNSRGWNVNKEQTTVDLKMETSSNQSTQSTNKVANDTSSTENNTEVIETTKQDLVDANNENSNVSGNEDTQDLVDPNNDDQSNVVNNEQSDQHIQENGNTSNEEPKVQKQTCMISISCATILNNMSKLDSDKKELIPSDGWILKPTVVEISDGDTVFNVLNRVTKSNKIHMEFSETAIYNSNYIEGINNIYEFDCGSLSGWVFFVNDQVQNISSSEIKVKNGDVIRWAYTCNLGKDVQ